MTSLLRRGAILLVAVPVLALSACGSDDDQGTTATTSTTAAGGTTTLPAAPALKQPQLVIVANAVCKKFNGQANKLTPPADASDTAALATFYGKLAKIAVDQHAALEALSADPAGQAKWDAFVTLHEQATDLVQGISPALKADDGKKAEGIVDQVNALTPKINAAADSFGAKVCGSEPG